MSRSTHPGAWAIIVATLSLPSPAAHGEVADLAQRGDYLACAGDCMACHTTKDDEPFAGARVDTPFGLIYSPNITPDRDTGIGRISDDDFCKILHQGLDKAGGYLQQAKPGPWRSRDHRPGLVRAQYHLQPAPGHRRVVRAGTGRLPQDRRCAEQGHCRRADGRGRASNMLKSLCDRSLRDLTKSDISLTTLVG